MNQIIAAVYENPRVPWDFEKKTLVLHITKRKQIILSHVMTNNFHVVPSDEANDGNKTEEVEVEKSHVQCPLICHGTTEEVFESLSDLEAKCSAQFAAAETEAALDKEEALIDDDGIIFPGLFEDEDKGDISDDDDIFITREPVTPSNTIGYERSKKRLLRGCPEMTSLVGGGGVFAKL